MGEGLILNGPAGQEKYTYSQHKFADGYLEGEKMGESIIINGPAAQETYKYAQTGNKFAEGYLEGEKMTEGLTLNGPAGQEKYKYAQVGNKFADGYGDRETMGETIRSTGPEKFITTSYVQVQDPVSWQGKGVAFPPVPPVPGFVATAAATASNTNKKGADGKEAIIDAQDSEKFADEATEKAQTRLPYASTLLQMQDPVAWQGAGVKFPPVPPVPGFVATAAGTAGNVNKKGADGKEAIIDAQDSEKFADEATEKAQTRLPYASTLIQLEDPVSWQGKGVAFPPVPPVPGFVATAAATASNTNKKGADGKEAIIDAQDSEKFADEATEKAQTRLPYASTLLQLEDPVSWQGAGVAFPPVPPVPGFVATAAGTAGNVNKKGADGKEAIIDAQDSEKFADEATEKAQTRLPYASTLLQMGDDDVSKMESIEEGNVPLNFHFIHIATEEGELIRME